MGKDREVPLCPFYNKPTQECGIRAQVRNKQADLNGNTPEGLQQVFGAILRPKNPLVPSLAELTQRRASDGDPILRCRAGRSGQGLPQHIVRAQQKCDFLYTAQALEHL